MTTATMCYSGFWSSVTTFLLNAPICIARVVDGPGRALVSAIYDLLSKNYSPWHLVYVFCIL